MVSWFDKLTMRTLFFLILSLSKDETATLYRMVQLLIRPLALRAGGLVQTFAVALGKMRGGDEAAGERHVEHRHLGLLEQVAGLVEAQFEIKSRRRAGQIFAKKPLQD